MPIIHISKNPLNNINDTEQHRIAPGSDVAGFVQATPELQGVMLIAVVNGQPCMRADWRNALHDNDVVLLIVRPRGGGGSNPLRVLASLAVLAFAGWAVGAMGLTGLTANLVRAGIVMLGNTLVNQLMPLPQQPESRQLPEPSPTYSLRGQSNIARIGQPITLHYGRHIVWPDLIMSPYYEYLGDDQWYHTLMCVGLGHIEVTDVKFGDVALVSLDAADYGVQVIYPGQGVTLLPASVFTADVSGSELSSEWSASGYSNPPGSTVIEIGVDFAFNGLVKINRNGDMQDHTVTVEVQSRMVNDAGVALTAWGAGGSASFTEVFTAKTVDAVRRTIRANVSTGRHEVRTRVTVDPINGQDNDKNTFRDVCVWGGLRGYGGTHPAYGDCTLLAVKVKANELLSQQSTQQISCLGHRHLKHWTTAGGWSGLQASRSIVWAMVDAYLNTNNGNQPENTLLLTELETLHTRLETLNNHFDYRFDETGAKLLPTMNMIARAGRSSVIHHIGRWRLIRDEPKTVPVQMFTADNMNGFNVSLSAPQDYDPDALIGTFIDADTWQQATLTYSDVSEPIRAETIDLPGITSRQHAWAELAYMVKAEKRRERGSFTTGMEGRIPVPHDLIAVCPEGVDWGHWGHVVAKTGGTLSLSNPLPFTSGKIMLRNSVGGSLGVFDITVTDDTEATATGLPAFDLPDIHREPIYYIAGETESSIILCKVTDLTPQANDQVQISFVVEDSGVYLAPGAVPDDGVSVIGGGGVNLAVPWLKSSGVSTTEGVCTLTFAWGAAPSAELYEADYKVNDTSWAQAALSGQLSYALQATPSQVMQFRVRAKAAGGIGAYQSLSITACGAAAVAPDPGQLALESPFIGPVLKVAWSLTAGVSIYKLRIYDTATMTLRREVETTASRYDYSYLDAIADGGTHRNMTLRLHTTRNGVVSDVYSQLVVSNPQVAALTGLQVVGFNAQVGVLYTAPTVSDWAGILIYMSETANFTPSAANLVYDGIEAVIGLHTATAAPYYVRVAAYDYWGRDNLNLSAQYSGSAILVDTAPIQAELDQLAEDLADANQTLTAAQNQLAQQQAQLATDLALLDTELSNADTALAQSLASTNQTLATANTNIAGLNSQLVTVNQSLAANATAISNTNTTLSATNTTLTATNNTLANVQTGLASANTAIAANATAISNTNTTLAVTNTTLTATNNTLAGVQTGLASANSAIVANADAITAANLELDTVPAQITNTIAAGVSATYITGQITATQITDGAISTPKLAAGSVIAGKIAAGAVEAGSIAAGAVIAGKIAAGAVTATNIAALAINSGHIVSDAITADKIAANAVTASEIAALAVTAGKIAANAVTANEIAANSVTSGKIAALSINAGHIVADAITSDKIAANAVTADELAANSVIAGKIATNAVTSDTIAANAITAGKIAALSIDASHIVADSITGDRIAANSIGTGELTALAVTADKLAVNAVTADKIDALAVTAAKIATSAITATKIAAGAITTAKISAGAVTANEIASETIIADNIATGAIIADVIASNAITTAKIAANAITAAKISALTITGGKIAANTLTADKLFVSDLSAITASMGTITTGKMQNTNGRVVFDLDAAVNQGNVISIKDTVGKLAFSVGYNGAAAITGALSMLSPESQYTYFSSAQAGYSNAYISSALTPATAYAARFASTNYHGSNNIYQRIRTSATTNQLIPFLVTATAVVDHYFTLWYRQSGQGSTWYPFISTYDPVGGDGSVTLTAVVALSVNTNDYVYFAATATDTSGAVLDTSKPYIKALSISAMAINI